VSIEKWHKKKEKKIFFCQYCRKSFTTDWYYKMHVAKHKETEELINCNQCERRYGPDYKKHHMQTSHAICEECDYIYKSNDDMVDHVCPIRVPPKRKLQEKDVKSTIDDIAEKKIKSKAVNNFHCYSSFDK
jgi:hypothetical protein